MLKNAPPPNIDIKTNIIGIGPTLRNEMVYDIVSRLMEKNEIIIRVEIIE